MEEPANFELNIENSRFASSSNEDIVDLLNKRHAKNTKRSTNRCIQLFKQYLREKGEDTEFEKFEKDKLKENLKHFYVDVRKEDGSEYKKSSVQNLRQGLKRYIIEKTGWDITSAEFSAANDVFTAKLTDLKRQGKGDTKHKDAIEDEDLYKLYDYFEKYKDGTRINPRILQQKVFFDILLHLCR